MGKLGQLLGLQSNKDNAQAVQSYVLDHIMPVDDVTYQIDKYNNILVTKGDAFMYPTYVCHTDSTMTFHDNYRVFRQGTKDKFWVGYATVKDNAERVDIGGDGKCGVYVCLNLLRQLKKVKIAFLAKQHEQFLGAMNVDLSFFSNSKWLIEPDKKGFNKLQTTITGARLTSLDMENAIKDQTFQKFGYELSYGGKTDVSVLKTERKLEANVIAISAGYVKDPSIVVEKDLLKAIQFCQWMATKFEEPPERGMVIYTPEKKVTQQALAPTGPVVPKLYCASMNCLFPPVYGENFCFTCRTKLAVQRCPKCNLGLYRETEKSNKICSGCRRPV